jgi:hypothetical protein
MVTLGPTRRQAVGLGEALPQRGDVCAEWLAEPRLKDDSGLTDMSGVLGMPSPDPEEGLLPEIWGVPRQGDDGEETFAASSPRRSPAPLSPDSPVAMLKLSVHQARILERHFHVRTVRELAHLSAVVQAVSVVQGVENYPNGYEA